MTWLSCRAIGPASRTLRYDAVDSSNAQPQSRPVALPRSAVQSAARPFVESGGGVTGRPVLGRQIPGRQIGVWALTIALGIGGGAALDALHVPLAWLLGSLFAVAAVSLTGRNLAMPPGARQVGQVALGTTIGLTFDQQVAAFVAGFLPIMLGAAVLSIFYGVVAGRALAKTSGVDNASAFFASLPGGVVEMSVQAERNGGDPAPVALAQSLRILFVVVTIPPIITVLGLTGVDPFEMRHLAIDPLGLLALLAMGAAVGFLLNLRRIANSWFLGPLGVAVLFGVAGVELSGMPVELTNLGQVMMGATLGLRYRRDRILALRTFIAPAVLSTAILVGLNVATGAGIGLIFGLPIPTMALAVSPGGMAEMSITAQVLHLGVPLVVAFHVVRIFIVIGFTGVLFRALFGRSSPG